MSFNPLKLNFQITIAISCLHICGLVCRRCFLLFALSRILTNLFSAGDTYVLHIIKNIKDTKKGKKKREKLKQTTTTAAGRLQILKNIIAVLQHLTLECARPRGK